MKYITLILLTFLFSILAFAESKSVQTISLSDQKYLGEHVLSFVKKGAKIRKSKPNDTNEYFYLFTALASINSDTADKYLVACLPYYKGSAPGAFYTDLVAKKGKKIIPFLNALKVKSKTCDGELYNCSSHSPNYIIDRIESKKYSIPTKDNIGDPFSYWSHKKILEKISEIKEYDGKTMKKGR